jgi:hypothetical protein
MGNVYIHATARSCRLALDPIGLLYAEKLGDDGQWRRVPAHEEPDASTIIELLRGAYSNVGRALENWLRNAG